MIAGRSSECQGSRGNHLADKAGVSAESGIHVLLGTMDNRTCSGCEDDDDKGKVQNA